MSKHTPGPWLINRESEDVIEGKLSIESVNAETQLSYFIAQVDECKSQEANARLIAAAPELLEACETLFRWLAAEDNHNLMPDFYERIALCNLAQEQARAAIAKAKGGRK